MQYCLQRCMFLLVLPLLLVAARPANAQMPGDPDTTFRYFKNASINAQPQYFSRQKGDSLVFEYEVKNAGKDEIADDEWTMRLMWQIPAKAKSFSLKAEDLSDARANYLVGCFCLGRGYYAINEGEISGIRSKNGVWQVHGSIQFQGRDDKYHSVDFSGNFLLVASEGEE
ncbi:MAG: hypothetical protein WD077_07875 [Bacteroidia bacterium]